MTNYNERLDDLLAAVYLAGTENGLSRRLTDAEEIMHRKKAFINGNHASYEAKQAILDWHNKQVEQAVLKTVNLCLDAFGDTDVDNREYVLAEMHIRRRLNIDYDDDGELTSKESE